MKEKYNLFNWNKCKNQKSCAKIQRVDLKLEFMFKMTSTINIIEELDLAGPTLILNKEDEQRLLESDNEDTTPNAKIESESDLPEIEICLTNLDNTFESDNAECQEIQSVLETDNEDINAQSDSELLTCS